MTTTTDTAAVLATLRDLDTQYIAATGPDASCWLAYPCLSCYGTNTEWWLSMSDNDVVETHEFMGLGDAGEEAALRAAIGRNRALCPAEPVAQEVGE